MNKKLSVILGIVLLAVCAPIAQATIQIDYSIDGGGTLTCASSAVDAGPITCASIVGPPTLTDFNALSNSPGNSSLAKELGAVLDISNTSGATHTIEIFIVAQNFTAPVTPPDIILNSHVGGTVVTGGAANLLSFQSCVDATNSLSTCPAGSIKSALGTPGITTAVAFKDDQFSTITSLTTKYSISEDLKITLGAGADINLSTSTTLTPVPEPMSIAMLGGVVLLTTRLIRRKRNQGSRA